MLSYPQARLITQQRNQYMASLDHVVRIMRREYLLIQRYTIEGRLLKFLEPIHDDRERRDNSY